MDPILLSTVLTSVLPAAIDSVKAWVGRKTGDKPAVLTVADYTALADSEVKKLTALASLDKSDGPSYPWVNATRQMQRPIVIAIVAVVWGYGALFNMPTDAFNLVSQMASAVFFFLFGERVKLNIRQR